MEQLATFFSLHIPRGIMAVSSNPNMREPMKALCEKVFELFGTL